MCCIEHQHAAYFTGLFHVVAKAANLSPFFLTRISFTQELIHIISDAEPTLLAVEPNLLTLAIEVHSSSLPCACPAPRMTRIGHGPGCSDTGACAGITRSSF